MKRRRLLLGLAAAAALALACGHKAPPIVPKPKAPAPPSGVRIETGCGELRVSFVAPRQNADGSPLVDLAALSIERKRGPLGGERAGRRRAAGGGGESGAAGQATATPTAVPTATVEPTELPEGAPTPAPPWIPESEFERVALLQINDLRIEGELPERIEFTDRGAYLPDHRGRVPDGLLDGYAYTYVVRGLNRRGREGLPSEPAGAVYSRPPAAPAGLAAATTEREVRLNWEPVGLDCSRQAPMEIGGYRVYRTTEPGVPAPVPLNPRPLAEPAFTDPTVESDRTYFYTIRAERTAGDTLSAPSAELAVATTDIWPPQPPTGLIGVASSLGVNLIWNSSPEPDLAGYRVYRRVRGGDWQLLNEELAPGTSFQDREVRSRSTYEYAVSAVDGSVAANESERSEMIALRAG